MLSKLFSRLDISPPAGLQPLRERFASLFDKGYAERTEGVSSLYAEAAGTAERLLADCREQRPLHGDLHHDNIIHGSRGWLAIDPKGVYGDPGAHDQDVPLDCALTVEHRGKHRDAELSKDIRRRTAPATRGFLLLQTAIANDRIRPL